MKITIYQIIPELDQDRLMFMPLSYFQKAGYPSPPAEIYESVFCGETEVATPEEIYRIFNRKDEADACYLEKIGFTGHSMSVSDILEKQHSPGESRFYFCDTFGFSQIAFQKENAMLPVQNHDNIPFEQVNRSKPGYLAYMDNGGISIHPCIQDPAPTLQIQSMPARLSAPLPGEGRVPLAAARFSGTSCCPSVLR